MLHAFETDVKTVVDKGGEATGFDVRANYKKDDRSNDLGEINDEIAKANAGTPRNTSFTVSELQDIRGIVDEEQYIPNTITCFAAVSGASSPIAATVQNTITKDWKNYTLKG